MNAIDRIADVYDLNPPTQIKVGSLVVDKAFVRLYGKLDATIFTVEDIDPMGLATLSYDEWGLHLTEPAWLDEIEAI